VFPTTIGTAMDNPNVRRDFRAALELVPGINPGDRTPGLIRHSVRHSVPCRHVLR